MQLSAQEVLALKVRIKEEMLRRSGYGSLAEFGRSDYDFEHVPEEGSTVFKEHGEKTNNLALQVSDIVGVKYVSGDGEPISGMNTELESYTAQVAEPFHFVFCADVYVLDILDGTQLVGYMDAVFVIAVSDGH